MPYPCAICTHTVPEHEMTLIESDAGRRVAHQGCLERATLLVAAADPASQALAEAEGELQRALARITALEGQTVPGGDTNQTLAWLEDRIALFGRQADSSPPGSLYQQMCRFRTNDAIELRDHLLGSHAPSTTIP